jgi:hypothetical protein
MEKLNKLIKELNTDIFCGVGTQIFFQDLEDFKMNGLHKMVRGQYKLGVLDGKNIFVNVRLKSNNMNLYDENGNVLINLSDYGYEPIDFNENPFKIT